MATDGLSRWGGEFVARDREAAFRARHLGERRRYAWFAFLLSAIIHVLFLPSDWRFAGTPHFWVAISARGALIAVSLACLAAMRRAVNYARLEALLVGWMLVTAVGVAVLVTTHSEVALFAILLVPLVFYLAVPVSFRLTLACGGGASLLTLLAFLLPNPPPTAFGLVVIVLCMNVALGMTVARGNRLRRLEWEASVELAESRFALEMFFSAAPVPIVVTRVDDGAVIRANDAAYAFFGVDRDHPGTGVDAYADSQTRAHLLDQIRRNGRISSFETRMRVSDGSVRDVLLAANQMRLGDVDCLMTGIVDITTRKVLEAHLEQMATTDALTGLANRARFFAVAESEIRRAARTGRYPSMLMIDLDHFKAVNDGHGHEAGDLALKAFADLAVGMMREHDTCARLGGEEFAVLLPETDIASATKLAERLRAAVEAMHIEKLLHVRLTVSIGVSRAVKGEPMPDAALSRADRALYKAKNGGRNRVSTATARLDAGDPPRQN